MPEIVTKYPDVTRQVLESAGAQCGRGAPQKILTACPRDSFCTMPGGEVCVYGLDQIPKMTQISRQELCEGKAASAMLPLDSLPLDSAGAFAVPALGVGLVWAAMRRRRSRPGVLTARRPS